MAGQRQREIVEVSTVMVWKGFVEQREQSVVVVGSRYEPYCSLVFAHWSWNGVISWCHHAATREWMDWDWDWEWLWDWVWTT